MASEYEEDPAKFQLYRHIYDNFAELTANAPERAKRVEIDRVIGQSAVQSSLITYQTCYR